MDFLDIVAFIFYNALFFAAPLIFTGLGAVFTERSGVTNIGLEGVMQVGAFTGIIFNLFTAHIFGSMTVWVSILVAMAAGCAFSLLLAVASITFRADQIIAGTALNMLASGATLFLVKKIFDGKGQTPMVQEAITRFNIPVLKDIPVIGPIFFQNVYLTSYLAILAAVIGWVILFKTPFGLRLRSVGEHPTAADTMGIKVNRMRYIGVMISGALGGIGGAIFSQSITLDYSHATISGQGFMAIAAMIFGKWNPLGMMGAAIFFGFAQSLSTIGSNIPVIREIPQVYLFILPYVLTILAIAGFIGKSVAPKALNIPYVKENR
ncbi:ABC transporter permease [Caldibacillus debilis]|uniref:ABC transporter permease n=1 Tax=Caldibacillus debilis TaxID=301148 RepID=UPI000369C124|nr:ABC transporter permease [Caldibacillus debilis]MBO2481445.1 ABC transporter permease [Bacillaceae bacterium]MBY6271872.1 ABC transporter permease [Bacillaceae bacterium]